MINFVNRLVIIIIINADADGARGFILIKMAIFVKKDHFSWLRFVLERAYYQF